MCRVEIMLMESGMPFAHYLSAETYTIDSWMDNVRKVMRSDLEKASFYISLSMFCSSTCTSQHKRWIAMWSDDL